MYRRENAQYDLEVSVNACCMDHVDNCQLAKWHIRDVEKKV